MKQLNLAPIVLFVYNRPQHTLRTLEALAKNELADYSVLYIYADGPKPNADEESIVNIEETRRILRLQQWCGKVHIIESNKNKGLADSIIEGVTEIVDKYGTVVVLEDDIVTAPLFLTYMNKALKLYEKENKIMHISGFLPYTTGAKKLQDTFFLRFMSCWGWATWRDRWRQLITDIDYLYDTLPKRFDFDDFNLNGVLDQFSQVESNYDGRLKTWAIKWYSTIFLKDGLCLYPKQSLVENIGFDGSGENTFSEDGSFDVRLAKEINVLPIKIEESKYAKGYLRRFYIFGQDSNLRKRIKRKLKSTFLYKKYAKLRYHQ